MEPQFVKSEIEMPLPPVVEKGRLDPFSQAYMLFFDLADKRIYLQCVGIPLSEELDSIIPYRTRTETEEMKRLLKAKNSPFVYVKDGITVPMVKAEQSSETGETMLYIPLGDTSLDGKKVKISFQDILNFVEAQLDPKKFYNETIARSTIMQIKSGMFVNPATHPAMSRALKIRKRLIAELTYCVNAGIDQRKEPTFEF
jgi:hypothetical protein